LSYIFYKVFQPEYKCKNIKPLPNENRDSEGTWNVCDDIKPTPPCVEYSFGIANDFRFEDAYRAHTGCEVKAFDPSMHQGDHQHSPGVYFHNNGIAAEKSDTYRGNEYNNANRVQIWKVDTVGGYMNRFGHTKGAVLKVDVEGAEWDSLLQALNDGTLLKWDQLLFEIHFWHYNAQNLDSMIDKWFKLIQGIEKQGWKLFYSHVNPMSTHQSFPNNFYVPCCYELSFMNMNNLQDADK